MFHHSHHHRSLRCLSFARVTRRGQAALVRRSIVATSFALAAWMALPGCKTAIPPAQTDVLPDSASDRGTSPTRQPAGEASAAERTPDPASSHADAADLLDAWTDAAGHSLLRDQFRSSVPPASHPIRPDRNIPPPPIEFAESPFTANRDVERTSPFDDGQHVRQMAWAEAESGPAQEMPGNFQPWWSELATTPLRADGISAPLDTNSLITEALLHSPQIRALSDQAVIARTAVARAWADFDPTTFVDSRFVRNSLPTGSVLDAGVDMTRLRDEDWSISAGIRRKNLSGAQWEFSQQLGTRTSNSAFFAPQEQGNTRLTLSFNQPLLSRSGQAYNMSLIVLADMQTRVASNETAVNLQDHLLDVTHAYWALYRERVLFVLKERHLNRASVILDRLEHRREVDSLESQIARARAAVSMRQAELVRSATSIRNAEARVRALVSSPDMRENRRVELIPTQSPTHHWIAVSVEDAVVTALEHRPEIQAATQEIESARIRLRVASNDLLPVLNLVLETYVSGLRDRFDVGNSWADQFRVGEPGYTAGLVFEVPLHRRAAAASVEKRRLEIRQLTNQLRAAIEILHADVEVAVREVSTVHRELQARYASMLAAEVDVRYLQRRWEALPGEDRSASFLLADLLDAQDRLAFEESEFAATQVEYALSQTELNRATGTLLQHEKVEIVPQHDGELPSVGFLRDHVEETPSVAPPPPADQ